jgi:hypothetical protein
MYTGAVTVKCVVNHGFRGVDRPVGNRIFQGWDTPPSSSGLGRRVLSAKTGVRFPVGVSPEGDGQEKGEGASPDPQVGSLFVRGA